MREDCRSVWDLAINFERAGPIIKDKLLSDLGINKWKASYQRCFVETFYPYLISLEYADLDKLRKVRGAKEILNDGQSVVGMNGKKEPFFFLQEVTKASGGKAIFDEILECTPLLVWLQPSPIKGLYWYLNEFRTLQLQGYPVVEFYRQHRDTFLRTIGHRFTDHQFRSLVKVLEWAPAGDFGALALIGDADERVAAARRAAIRKQQ